MNFTCGTDIVEMKRLEKIIENPSILIKIFHPEEIKYFKTKSMNLESIAGVYAAKEAFLKAMHIGLEIPLTDIIVLHETNGSPYLKLQNEALKKAKNFTFSLSISHDGKYALAFVIAFCF